MNAADNNNPLTNETTMTTTTTTTTTTTAAMSPEGVLTITCRSCRGTSTAEPACSSLDEHGELVFTYGSAASFCPHCDRAFGDFEPERELLDPEDVALVSDLLRDHPEVLEHSLRVAVSMTTREAARVALFHDVLEDVPAVAESEAACALLRRVLGPEAFDSMRVLTRSRDAETYAEYVLRVARSEDPVALAVKLADLRDHLALESTLRPTLRTRYERAMEVLTRAAREVSA